MSKLSDDLNRFKEQRQHERREDNDNESKINEIETLVIEYRELEREGRHILDQKKAGSDITTNEAALERRRDVFRTSWDRLSETKRQALAARLFELKLLPEILTKALKIFGGKVTKIM